MDSDAAVAPPPPGGPLPNDGTGEVSPTAPTESRGTTPAPPGPARAPEEVTLGFAMVVPPSGGMLPLSDSLVLATILCAVDGERSRKTFVWGRPGEVVEAVAPIYWPLLVLPTSYPGRVALFDGTGVWNKSFRHSPMPPVGGYLSALAQAPPSPQLPAWLQGLRTPILYDTAPATMTVEGLLPADLPLLPDILTQSAFRTEPASVRAGFLPTRRPFAWYETAVTHISQSLQQFDAELAELGRIRSAVAVFGGSASERLDLERKQVQLELASRSRFYANAEMDRDVDSVHAAIREQIVEQLDRIRVANVVISESRSAAKVGELLVQRASARRQDITGLKDRVRRAVEAERRSEREIREARQRIAGLHERERDSYAVLSDRVAVVEQHSADEVSAHDLLRDDVLASVAELLAAFDRQIARRATERQELASHFLSLPALEGIQTLWFPFWVAALSGGGRSRCVVFPPMRVRAGVGVAGSVKTLFGGVVLPLEPRTAQFGQSLRQTLEATIERDPWLAEVTRASSSGPPTPPPTRSTSSNSPAGSPSSGAPGGSRRSRSGGTSTPPRSTYAFGPRAPDRGPA